MLRRYNRRWKIERLIAWLGNRRRILIRYESHLANFHGFALLACAHPCKLYSGIGSSDISFHSKTDKYRSAPPLRGRFCMLCALSGP